MALNSPKRSLTIFELLVVCCIIFILAGTFAVYARITLRVAGETALRHELAGIRLAIQHYSIVNDRLPENLSELTKERLTKNTSDSKINPIKYLKINRMGSDGCPLDPFMNRYSYNRQDGRINSITKGYESW